MIYNICNRAKIFAGLLDSGYCGFPFLVFFCTLSMCVTTLFQQFFLLFFASLPPASQKTMYHISWFHFQFQVCPLWLATPLLPRPLCDKKKKKNQCTHRTVVLFLRPPLPSPQLLLPQEHSATHTLSTHTHNRCIYIYIYIFV